jgi:hypothetical protein
MTSDDAVPRSPHDALQELAHRLGVSMESLFVLAESNEPFLAGTPAHWTQAEWFTALWRQHIPAGRQGHLRRVHYILVSRGDARLWNGIPYDNSKTAWGKLKGASRYARYLGLVDPEELIDERTEPPRIVAFSRAQPAVAVGAAMAALAVPRLHAQVLPGEFTVPDMLVAGYDYASADQRYHLELWIEKSTMNDVLLPLCQRYHANLVVGTGTMSITSVVDLLRRAAQHAAANKRGTRIFYLSDFDRAGHAMPRQVSRQIEYWHDRYAPGVDIRVQHIVLTGEQIDRYNLPNDPGKSAPHNRKFETVQKRGAVELDALEALFPGELARIVEEALLPYLDTALAVALATAAQDAQAAVTERWQAQTQPLREDLASIAEEIAPSVTRYQEQLTALSQQLTEEMQPYGERLWDIDEAVTEAAERFEPDLPARPDAAPVDDDREPWLYDSRRAYLAQLGWYHRHKAGGEEDEAED